MTLHVPVFMQPAGGDAALTYTAQEWRQYTRALMVASSPVASEQGVINAGSMAVAQRAAGANFSVDVASGSAFVLGDDVTGQGTYFAWNDGAVNVATPAAPGSGTQVHRLVLQIQDKLNNGVWSGYQGVYTVLADTGSGTPAEPNSAITLAFISIAAGQPSVQNANITDYRQRTGVVNVTKGGDNGRGNNSQADDPDLQLLGLQASAEYGFEGQYLYNGGVAGTEGDFAYGWRVSSGTVMSWERFGFNLTGGDADSTMWTQASLVASQTTGTGNNLGVMVKGRISTAAAPAFVITQWAQNTNAAANTTLLRRSYLRAWRIS